MKTVLLALFALTLIPVATADEITFFNDVDAQLDMAFFTTDEVYSYFINVPLHDTIIEASMRIAGADLSGELSLPADVVLVTDVSVSMDNMDIDGAPGLSRLDVAKLVISESVERLLNESSNRVGLISYHSSTEPGQSVDLTSSDTTLYQQIAKYQTKSQNTCFDCAINDGRDKLVGQSSPDDLRIIILMSDGTADKCDTRPQSQCTPALAAADSIAAACDANLTHGIIVHAVAFGTGADEATLQAIAECTGGLFAQSNSLDGLQEIYRTITDQITSQVFPTPAIEATFPVFKPGWKISKELATEEVWTTASCGADAVCVDFIDIIRENQAQCTADPCRIDFEVSSETPGLLTLSELYILTEDERSITCGPQQSYILDWLGSPTTVDFNDVFVYNYPGVGDSWIGDPVSFTEISPSDITISGLVPLTGVQVSQSGMNSMETINLQITTDMGFVSDSCPVSLVRGAPPGTILCVPESPRVVLHPGEDTPILLTDIFLFGGDPGDVSSLDYSSLDVTITEFLPDFITASPNGISGEQDVIFTVTTNVDVISEACPVTFFSEDAAPGAITCKPPLDPQLLEAGNPRTYNFDDIFTFSGDYGMLDRFTESSSPDILITPALPLTFTAESFGTLTQENVFIQLKTDINVISDSCKVPFFDLPSQCNSLECLMCDSTDFDCFVDNDCLDRQINVFNPSVSIRPSNIFPILSAVDYTVTSFFSGKGEFLIQRVDDTERFEIDGLTNEVPHGEKDVAIMDLSIDGVTTRICPVLQRIEYDIGEDVVDPETELLVPASRAVTGYFEDNGRFRSVGPYIFTVKVWLRK